MNDHSRRARPIVESDTPPSPANRTKPLIALACVAFFPLMYFFGKALVAWFSWLSL